MFVLISAKKSQWVYGKVTGYAGRAGYKKGQTSENKAVNSSRVTAVFCGLD